MQDLELVSPDFVICDDCKVISTKLMNDSSKEVKSYRIVRILNNRNGYCDDADAVVAEDGFYHVGDRVVTAGEGAKIKLRDNPTEYWMFDINAIVGKVGK